MNAPELNIDGLPAGYAARVPEAGDVAAAVDLLTAHQHAAKGSASVDPDAVEATLVGVGSWTRRQALVHDRDRNLVGWLAVQDRAAGRVLVEVTVSPTPDSAAAAATGSALFSAAQRYAADILGLRALSQTLLDSGAYADDGRQQRWLAEAGYEQTRTWLQMSRPVQPTEAAAPELREGVRVRRVRRHEEDGLPVAQDLQDVHRVLEESFQDHFSSYRESFPEFVGRLREDPGHRWDHWWLATVSTPGGELPAGAIVCTISPPDGEGVAGTYIDYIGVHRRARGRGVAKALLHTVIADAAERGRDRVTLEVDADSPTGADGLYTSLGWVTAYRTQSWHRHLTVGS